MNRTESKNEMVLKIAVFLAMIGSLVGCGGVSSSSPCGGGAGTTTPSAALGSGSHADIRPTAQVLQVPRKDRTVKRIMFKNGQDA
jgi:Flp pilus assembly protein TadD